ncbi:MAG: hypothetical protein JXB29_02740 [Sedimentisphaerales bacterium]|nr:hypothetical protein [Sedimentisphaerales bacterium]
MSTPQYKISRFVFVLVFVSFLFLSAESVLAKKERSRGRGQRADTSRQSQKGPEKIVSKTSTKSVMQRQPALKMSPARQQTISRIRQPISREISSSTLRRVTESVLNRPRQTFAQQSSVTLPTARTYLQRNQESYQDRNIQRVDPDKRNYSQRSQRLQQQTPAPQKVNNIRLSRPTSESRAPSIVADNKIAVERKTVSKPEPFRHQRQETHNRPDTSASGRETVEKTKTIRRSRSVAEIRLNKDKNTSSSVRFVRPSNERSQHVRLPSEKSQHVKDVSTESAPGRKLRVRPSRFKRPSYIVKRPGRKTRIVKHIHRQEHVYIDRHDRVCNRIIWPSYRFAVSYNWGPYFSFSYVYPYHHRKYVFISLGGYWPVEYRYARYYWYGYHPYWWYGCAPTARQVQGDTYNYYTYNYYGDEAPEQGTYRIDDIGEPLAGQIPEEPAAATEADMYFEEGVKAFEAGDYEKAEEEFANASELAPDDIIMPFAYAQALFAGEKYSQAAEVLRISLSKVTPEQEGVFYPRGLYTEDEVLFEQIERLAEQAELYNFDGDLQLLLGYQLLGIGKIDEASMALYQAKGDWQNTVYADILLNLLEKISAGNTKESL